MALTNQRSNVYEDATNMQSVVDPEAEFAAKLKADEEAFRAEQAMLESDFKAKIDAQTKADADAFAKAQADIAAMMEKEQQGIAITTAKYKEQQAAATAAAEQAAKAAQANQIEIQQRIAESQRVSAEMAAKVKAEMESMQRTSAAKTAGRRKAGRSVADRSILSGFGLNEGSAPTLGGAGSLGGNGASLGTTGTLGVG